MRFRLLATSLLVTLGLCACGFYFEANAGFEPDPLTLDEAMPTQSFVVRMCWEGEGEPNEAVLYILIPTMAAGRVTLELERESSVMDSESHERTKMVWSGDEVDAVCEVGTPVRFTLDDPADGALDIEWLLTGGVNSERDEAVEHLEVTIYVEPS